MLLARSEMRDQLEPWSGQLVADRSTTWGTAPIDRDDQWLVTWPHPSPNPVWTRTQTRPGLAEWARGERATEIACSTEQGPSPSEYTGRWWAIVGNAAMTTRRWPGGRDVITDVVYGRVTRECVHDRVAMLLREDECVWPPQDKAVWQHIPVPATARVLEVTSAQAWCDLCRRFPLEVTASRRGDWWRTTGRDGRWVIPDWSLVADEWGAVHLPVANYLELAGHPLSVDADTCIMIAGWTPDSTQWLTGLPNT